MPRNVANLPLSLIIRYAVIAIPLAFASLPLYIHLPDYYVRNLSIDLEIIGFLLLFIRLVDAIQDPIIGWLADTYPQLRSNFILIGIFILSVGLGILYIGLNNLISINLQFALGMLFSTTGLSLTMINLTTFGAVWHDNPHSRTKISAIREGCGLIGLIIAGLTPAILASHFASNLTLRYHFLIYLSILIFTYYFYYPIQTYINSTHSKNNERNDLRSLSKILINYFQILKKQRYFFIICFLNYLSATLPAILFVFFVKDYLQLEEYLGLFLTYYFLSGIIMIPLWIFLGKKFNKINTWVGSLILSLVTFIWAFYVQMGDLIPFSIICCLTGLVLGADLAFPSAILGDKVVIDDDKDTGKYFAILTILPKVAIAIASGLSFIILSIVGFDAGKVNSLASLNTLKYLYALLPCVLRLIAIIMMMSLKKDNINE